MKYIVEKRTFYYKQSLPIKIKTSSKNDIYSNI